MHKVKQLLSWLDKNLLFVLTTFLIAFIPLFPKIPLFEIIPGYIVRARAEDALIFFTAIIWIKDAYQKRFAWKTTYFAMVVLYAIVGLFSITFGSLLQESIPKQLLHIGKSGLHLFRYLEYFALFFFTYSSIKTKKQLQIVLATLAATVFLIVAYGIGQAYFHLPLYSTMNREYSKGVTLYLEQGARPQSTFAGHYDLAAYLVIVLPLIFSLALNILELPTTTFKKLFSKKTTYISVTLHFVHIIGAWMLVTSGSKTALLAYVIGILIVLFYYIRKLGNLKQQLKWGSIALLTGTIALVIFLNFFATNTRDKFISLTKTIISPNQTQTEELPDDLVGDGSELKKVVTITEDGTEEVTWIRQQSSFSKNALKYGLSLGIRLDTLWPNALLGFTNNPLFGNGYATLASINEEGAFSYAESTDNNFLRTLGETGILGFITFYGFILIILRELFKNRQEKTPVIQAIRVGFIGSTIGLLINATYIDVFAASKVAYTYWAFAGLVLSMSKINPTKTIKNIIKHLYKHKALYFAIIILSFSLHRNPFSKYSLVKNLEISASQLESLVTAKCFVETGSFTVCRNDGTVLKDNLNIYSMLLVPFLKIYNSPMMFYVLNITIAIIILITLYKLLPKLLKKYQVKKVRQLPVFTSLVLFILTSALFQYSDKPLSNQELLLFVIILPLVLMLYTFFMHKIKYRIALLIQISSILFLSLLLVNQNFDTKFLTNFRNNAKPNKYLTVEAANIHFHLNKYLVRENDFYLITTLNPYYIDLFSNNYYNILPLSPLQDYSDNYSKVYPNININKENLVSSYSELLKNGADLNITNADIALNQKFTEQFNQVKSNFDLSYIAIGCNDLCNLYSVKPESIKVSPIPSSINNKQIELSELNNNYSFAVVSNRFEKPDQADKLGYYVTNFAQFLQKNINQENNFTIITGDTYHDNSNISQATFNKLFNRTPILYTPGNFDLNQTKFHKTKNNYFYTDSEFFLILNVSKDSTVTLADKKFIYNAFLTLEKLANIENIIIISHNLNWEDRSNPENFIFDLERKLEAFPEKDKFIITSNHLDSTLSSGEKTSIKHLTNETTKTQYFTSFIRNWENDSFLEFVVGTNNIITPNYKIKNQNF